MLATLKDASFKYLWRISIPQGAKALLRAPEDIGPKENDTCVAAVNIGSFN